MDFPVLKITDEILMNIDEVFANVSFVRGEMYSGTSYRRTMAFLPEESAFVYGNKLYWGLVALEEVNHIYGTNHIQLLPCEQSMSKILGQPSKYWFKREKHTFTSEWVQ